MDQETARVTAGAKISALRRERRLTGQQVADETGISTNTISLLENGRINSPRRTTIETLLAFLDGKRALASQDRRQVLEAFGYRDGLGLPGPDDIRRAVRTWANPFKLVPFPSYLVDYSQRIFDWNDAALLLIGSNLKDLAGKQLTVFDIAFSRAAHGNVYLLGRERLLREVVRVMKSEFQPLLSEDWCRECVDNAMRRYPEFKALWDEIRDDELLDIAIRSMGPVEILVGGTTRLNFQIVGVDLANDPRFRAVQYLPQDEATSAACFALFHGKGVSAPG